MKKLLILIICLILIRGVLGATYEWDVDFDSGFNDYAGGLVVNDDIYVAGRYQISGSTDIKIVKYDLDGNHLLDVDFNYSSSFSTSSEFVRDMTIDSSGDIYVVGSSTINADDYLIIKYMSNGTLLWNKTYNGGINDVAYGVVVDDDNVYVTGVSKINNNDYYTIKYDSDGNHLWNRSFDGGAFENGRDIAIDSFGNIYVTGTYDGDIYTIKYDSDGNHLWNFTTDNGGVEDPKGIVLDSSDNIIIAGVSFNGANSDYFTVKYNSSGNHLWNRSFDSGENEFIESVIVDDLEDIYVTGYLNNGVNNDYYTIKYNSSGDYLWNISYDGGYDDRAKKIDLDSDGNIYVLGYYSNGDNYDYKLIKYKKIIPEEINEEPDTPSVSSGGSGGGKRVKITKREVVECSKEWTCGSWSECKDNTQRRECLNECEGLLTDIKNCKSEIIEVKKEIKNKENNSKQNLITGKIVEDYSEHKKSSKFILTKIISTIIGWLFN